MSQTNHAEFATFERRLHWLLQDAAKKGLCPGCISKHLATAASAIVERLDTEQAAAHGFVTIDLAQPPSTTRH